MNKFLIGIITTALFSSLSIDVFAHGEDRHGPHGGYIRMPGAFHTEVVKEKQGYRIYLLDINWKNPTVENSSVQASLEVGGKKTHLICSQEKDSYFCKSTQKPKGQLNVLAQRQGQAGGVAIYKLPLKLEVPETDHNAHH